MTIGGAVPSLVQKRGRSLFISGGLLTVPSLVLFFYPLYTNSYGTYSDQALWTHWRGLQDTAQEYLNIDKLTVFVGEQGTGKSTVAKLYATFAWIEKSIVQNKFSCGQFDASTFSSLLGFYRMEGYLRDATEIDYIGDGISLSYRNSVLQVKEINLEKYILPKIQYIPAERNLVGVIDKYEQISFRIFCLFMIVQCKANASRTWTCQSVACR